MLKQFSPFPALTRLGLSEGEIIIYTTLLEDGELEVAAIVEQSGLKKGDCYNKIYRLSELGLIEEVKKGKIQRYRIRDPHVLETIATERYREATQIKAEIETALPTLLSSFTLHSNKPSVRSLEGVEGLQAMYDELNASGTTSLLLMRSVYDDKRPKTYRLAEKQVSRQVKLGIKMRALMPLTEKMQAIATADVERLTENRFIDPATFKLEAHVFIWNDTVALVSLRGEVVTTIITNPAICQTQRAMFETIWQASAACHYATLAR